MFTGSTSGLGEELSLGDTVDETAEDGVVGGADGVLTGSPLHAAANTNTRAHHARRMPGRVSAPT
jgi:hypothetical protein